VDPEAEARALRLGGFALAHAAWSVEDGETLCTLAVLEIDGERELVRYEADSIPESVEAAHADLDARLSGGGVAALVMDTFATPEGGARRDTLYVELFACGPRQVGSIIQPYVPARGRRIPVIGRRQAFAVLGSPEITDEIERPDAERQLIAGILEHPHGPRLWRIRSAQG